eukprot:4343127-Lingulodinium_polyedra.AAC.1
MQHHPASAGQQHGMAARGGRGGGRAVERHHNARHQQHTEYPDSPRPGHGPVGHRRGDPGHA